MFNGKRKMNPLHADERLQSVAIIMDGNGRWARRRALPRTAGHAAGAARIEEVLKIFREIGVHHVTLYAFSTENWNRPKEEVDMLMDLVYRYVDTVAIPKIIQDGQFCIRFIGDKSALSEKLRNKCLEAEGLAEGRPYVCNVALNYGGRDEIVHAANRAIEDGVTHLSAADLSARMYTCASPDPDLIIRTGGDFRVSNFLLWQSAYSEYVFTKTLWPDFGRQDIVRAVREFYGRQRRFGGLAPEDEKMR